MDELFSSPQHAEFPASLHLSMVKDSVRMEAYERAMKEVIKPGDVVIDVGTGTGILALMASRIGASKVYGIEKSDMVDFAIEIKALNCPSADIEFLKADVFDVKLPSEKADVVICELFGNFGIDENVVEVLEYVRNHLMKPDGIIIPATMELMVAPVQCTTAFRDIAHWDCTETGFDFSPMQDLAYNAVYQVMDEPVKLLTKPSLLAAIDFTTIKTAPSWKQLQIKIDTPGVIHGIAGWFSTALSGQVNIDCGFSAPSTHWGQILFPIGDPLEVQNGSVVNFNFTENADRNSSVWNWHGSIKRPQEDVAARQFNYSASRQFV